MAAEFGFGIVVCTCLAIVSDRISSDGPAREQTANAYLD